MNPVASSIVRRYAQLAKTIQKGGKIDASFLSSHYAYPVREDVIGVSTPEAAEPNLADDKALSIPFVISTFEEDRDGDVVYPMGCRLENYDRNPVVFFGHQSYEVPIGKSKSPQGKLCVYPEENRLRATCYFDPDDPDAVFIYQKCKNGYLSAASVAFVPIIAHRRVRQKANLHENRHENPPGWYFEEYDLTEWSIVGVPANAGAIRDSMDQERSFISPFLYKAMKPFAKQAKTCFNGWCPCPPCPDSKCAKLFVTDPAEGVNKMASKPVTKSAGSVHKHNCKDCSKSKPCGDCQKKALQKGVKKNTQADMETSTVNVPKKTSKKEDCVSRKIDFLVHEGHKPPNLDPSTAAIAYSYCGGGKGYRTAAVEKVGDGEIAYLLRGIGTEESVRMVVKGKKVTSLVSTNCSTLSMAKKALGFSVTKALNEASGTEGGYTVPPGQAGKKTKKKAAKDFDEEEMDEADKDDKKGEKEGKKDDMKDEDMEEEESDKGDDADEVTKDESDETGGVVKSESDETGGVIKGEDGDEEMDDEEEVEKGEKGDKKEPYNDGAMGKDTTEMPDEPLPSAQILANLYSHLKSAMKYINDENPRHEHDEIKNFLENHKADLAGHMEEYKGLMKQHHKPHDIDEMVKAIEGPAAGSEAEPDANLEGEEGMVAEGDVPPEDQGERPPGDEQVHPMEEKAEEPVEEVTETEEVETPDGSKEGEMTEEDVVDKGAEEAPGEGMEEDEKDDMTTKSTQEILERYRHPKSGKWETRKRFIQNGKLLPIGSKPVKKGMPMKSDADKSHFEAIRDAGQHMYDLSKAVDLPRHHTTGLMHHANELGKICSKMEGGMETPAPEHTGEMEEKMCSKAEAQDAKEHLTPKDPDTKDPQLEEKGVTLMDGNNHLKPKKDPKLIDKSNDNVLSKEILDEFAAIKRLAKSNGVLIN